MNTLNLTTRLISAAAAAATTVALFSAVISISEPQRELLMAKSQRLDKLPAASVVVALASNGTPKAGK